MPVWLLLLLAGGAGYYYLSKEATLVERKTDQPPKDDTPKPINPAELVNFEKASGGGVVFGDREIIARKPAHWPEGDICAPAISGLPDDKRLDGITGKYTLPSIREMALLAAKNDDAVTLQRAADLADSPEFADAYKIASDCMRKRAVEIDPTSKPTWSETKGL